MNKDHSVTPTRRPPPPPPRRPAVSPPPRPEVVSERPAAQAPVRRPPPPPGRPAVAAVRPATTSPTRPSSGLSALKKASQPAPEPAEDTQRPEPALRAEPPRDVSAPVNFATAEDMRSLSAARRLPPDYEPAADDSVGRAAIDAVRKSFPVIRVVGMSDGKPRPPEPPPAPRWPRWVPREFISVDDQKQFAELAAEVKKQFNRDIRDARPVIYWWPNGTPVLAFFSQRIGYFTPSATSAWSFLPNPRVDWDVPF